MLVIHPKDKTTAMLSVLYDGLEAQVVADCRSTKEMGHLLHHLLYVRDNEKKDLMFVNKPFFFGRKSLVDDRKWLQKSIYYHKR